MAHLDDEFAQSNVQFALLTVVCVDHNLLTINAIKHTTHNAIQNIFQWSNSKHFLAIS